MTRNKYRRYSRCNQWQRGSSPSTEGEGEVGQRGDGVTVDGILPDVPPILPRSAQDAKLRLVSVKDVCDVGRHDDEGRAGVNGRACVLDIHLFTK